MAKETLQLSSIFIIGLAILGAIGALGVGWLVFIFQDYQDFEQRSNIAERVVTGSYQLTTLTGEYLIYQEPRAEMQWRQRHLTLGELLNEAGYRELSEDHRTSDLGDYYDRSLKLFDRVVVISRVKVDSIKTERLAEFQKKRLASELLTATQSLASQASLAAKKARLAHEQATYRTTWMIGGFILVLTGLFLILWWFLATRVINPIRNLRDDILMFGEQNDQRIETIRDDEIGEVANSFNKIIERLRETLVSRDELIVEVEGRKKTEEDLLEVQARLSGILRIAPEAVITIDEEMSIRLFNKGAERIFGYSAKEVLLQPLDMLMPERYRGGHAHHVKAFEDSGDGYRLMDKRQDIYGLKKDGTEFPASASVSKLESGGETIYTVMLHDITERLHIQDALIAAKGEAETASHAKSQFLAAVSHELRTPLNAILGFSQILKGEYFGPLGNKKYQEYAKDIDSSGEHLLSLVDDLLDISTIEAGKQSLSKEELSTTEVITECVKIVDRKALNGDIYLVTSASEDLPPLYADFRATKQILLNLLSNAIKFTPKGGKITVSAKAGETDTTITVTDTGKGIPAEKLPELTDMFIRAEDDSYKAEKGWGLGLSITKSLVELHGGKLDIKSKVGKGTTVTVTLPNSAP